MNNLRIPEMIDGYASTELQNNPQSGVWCIVGLIILTIVIINFIKLKKLRK